MTRRTTALMAVVLLTSSAVSAQETGTDSATGNEEVRSETGNSPQSLTDDFEQTETIVAEKGRKWTFTPLEGVWDRKKYWKLAFNLPRTERTDGVDMTWKTAFSISLQQGRNLYFHSKPLWGMVKFGLDYGFMDLSYSKLKLKDIEAFPSEGTAAGSNPDGFDDIVSPEPDRPGISSIMEEMGINLGMHKIDYSLHVGPTINVNPWKHLIVSLYFHAKPTATGIIENENFSYGFGVAFAAGFSASYKALTIGVEGQWSKIKYKQMSFNEDYDEDLSYDEDLGYEDFSMSNIFNTETFKLRQRGPRLYVAIRF